SCPCSDGGPCAGPGPVRRAEGNVAPPHDRLDLGRLNGDCRSEFAVDPRDPAVRPLEPDPSAVDLHAGHGAARGVASQAASSSRSSPDHDDDFYRRAGHRRTVHAAPRADHARGGFRPVKRLRAGAEFTPRWTLRTALRQGLEGGFADPGKSMKKRAEKG